MSFGWATQGHSTCPSLILPHSPDLRPHQPPRLPSSFPPAFVCPCAFMPSLCWRSGPGCQNHSAHAQNRKCPETYPPPQGPAVQRYQHPSSLVPDWDNSEGSPNFPWDWAKVCATLLDAMLAWLLLLYFPIPLPPSLLFFSPQIAS